MKHTITVTERDIIKAQRKSGLFCPIARAIGRHKFSAGSVYVTSMYVKFLGGRAAQLPPSAKSFISDFDSGKNVNPFKFTLEVP